MFFLISKMIQRSCCKTARLTIRYREESWTLFLKTAGKVSPVKKDYTGKENSYVKDIDHMDGWGWRI